MFAAPDRVRARVAGGFDGCRVLVVGDLMLDRYLRGEVARISPEAPVPVVRLTGESVGPGGAANVACNLASLGVATAIAGWTGDDADRQVLLGLLTASGVSADGVVVAAGRPTTTKTRVQGGRQQLVRIDHERTHVAPPEAQVTLTEHLESQLEEPWSAVVLSDYAKGVVARELCEVVIGRCRRRGVPVLVDPKGLDFPKYAGATAVTPNAAELAAATRVDVRDGDALVQAAVRLRDELALEFVVLTRGEDGMTLVDSAGTHHIPARAQEVFDVSGAGDTAIATLAAGLAGGLELRDAATLANLAAGVIVTRTGTVPISRDALVDALPAPAGAPHVPYSEKVLDAERATHAAERWRTDGEVVGFTNGCFDLLHAGHVAYLEWARGRCDRLVVGLNTDSSVRALKGEGRPVQPQDARAAVLAGLTAVDAVVLFDDATPLELIRSLRPDVLVKGGDYAPDEVVGAAEVRSWGGELLLAPTLPGFSTSAIVGRLRGARAR